MPQIPRYNSPGTTSRTVSPSAIPSIRQDPNAPASAFGAPDKTVAVAADELNKAAISVFEHEREKADQIKILDAENKLSELSNGILVEVSNKRGENSFGAWDYARDKWIKGLSEVEKDLNSDRQRIGVKQRASGKWSEIDMNVQSHIAKESRIFDDKVTESSLDNAKEDAANNAMSPEIVSNSISKQVANILDYANRYGLPEQWVEQKVRENISKTHVKVVEKMLADNQDLTASGYFKANKNDIEVSDQKALSNALEEGTVRGESQRQADKLWSDSGGDIKKALDSAAKITDPKIRDMTENRLKEKNQTIRQIESQERENIYLQAANIIDKNRGTTNARELIPPSEWVKLTNEQRNALQARAEDPPNDDKTWIDFINLSASEIGNLSRVQFETEYWANFDKSHRVRAEEMWNSAQETKAKGALNPNLSSTMSFEDQVKNVLKEHDIVDTRKPRGKIKDEKDILWSQFETEASARVHEFELTKLNGKRKATTEEIQVILDDMIKRKVFIEKSWWRDPEKLTANVANDERNRAYVPMSNIPEQDRLSITSAIRKKGKKLDANKIERAYAAFLLKDKALWESIINE